MMTNDKINYPSVVRRNGEGVTFDQQRIRVAITKAMLNDGLGVPYNACATELSESQRMKANLYTAQVVSELLKKTLSVSVEEIQDIVELTLMRAGEHELARSFIRYRDIRTQLRNNRSRNDHPEPLDPSVRMNDSTLCLLSSLNMLGTLMEASIDLPGVDPHTVHSLALQDLYDGIPISAVHQAYIMSAQSLIERDPAFGFLAARLLLRKNHEETLEIPSSQCLGYDYRSSFERLIQEGIDDGQLDSRLNNFNLPLLAESLRMERDLKFDYLGLHTLYDRYFLKKGGRRIELPQTFFMRVAMGLAINEVHRNERAIEFYEAMSSFDFLPSTPTLFNSGTVHPQLSSCFLSTIPDDLNGIFLNIRDNALLQKYAGGVSNDWSSVRALGSKVKGTHGTSQGTVPFLKVANDTAVAVNQGGKRLGAVCAYMETWHLDIEEFLDLRKNTGDDRRRTHDMHTANWIPDLFMKRVTEGKDWTLFSPVDVPGLHDKFGQAFESAYCNYEEMAATGLIPHHRTMPARVLWRKMLAMLFETGHPWMTFKDACNIRNPQWHAGVIHNSNLCTEITLNTSDSETAVCNLGSVNLLNHIKIDPSSHSKRLSVKKLRATIHTAVRMLDNVIDINLYAVEKAKAANLQHRPIGLGVMGLHDSLQLMEIPFDSEEGVEFSDSFMETFAFFTYSSSVDLAEERGAYRSFDGSQWSHGILPLDSLRMLAEVRGEYFEGNFDSTMNWDALRERIQYVGMRNSHCIALAPTATIANIAGVSASVEPHYQNLYTKTNLSGNFTVVNRGLVFALKRHHLWDDVMIDDLKYFNGQVSSIKRIPEEIRRLFATAFEMDPKWIIEAASRRQKWIDQSQSLNLFVSHVSGSKLDQLYRLAWVKGLKTTYYLRSKAATSAEKSTTMDKALTSVSSMSCEIGEECESCT